MHYPILKTDHTVCSCGDASCSSVGKHPASKRGYKDATTDRAKLEEWFGCNSKFNVGIATGKVSAIVVLDVDPKNGGNASLAALEAQYGKLPDTWTVKTGGGGRHFYFAYPSFDVPSSHSSIGAGLDFQSDGSLVVASPSLHASGARYEFVKNFEPESFPIAPTPRWLEELALNAKSVRVNSDADWQNFVSEGVHEGNRNDAITRLAGHLLRKDVLAPVVLELLLAWNRSNCEPPLPDAEVAKIVTSIARRELQRRQG